MALRVGVDTSPAGGLTDRDAPGSTPLPPKPDAAAIDAAHRRQSILAMPNGAAYLAQREGR